MNRKLQVFVSSTYTDLKRERQAAVEAILKAGHIPAGMELFAAGSDEQMKVIRRWIDNSDVYLLILGGRYGSIDPHTKKSYTQLEYEYALETEKPLFALYMTKEYFDQKVGEMRTAAVEMDNSAALQEFRRLVTSKMCASFDNLASLQLAVFQSMSDFNNDTKLVGWVRGDEVVNAKQTLEQMTVLQIERDAIRKELEELKKVSTSSPLKPLSEEAMKLLRAMSRDARGVAHLSLTSGGFSVESNGKRITPHPVPHRAEVRWRAAAQDLVDRGYANSDEERDLFQLNHVGYEAAERLLNQNPASPPPSS
ncbi:DUF4062 domain-containing protein [Gemmata sp.]|uniref:DUF4062 domain-containing protein n=1 Tax=Gemmata sp. TaxID=1914242 RepID=UPI003F7027B2